MAELTSGEIQPGQLIQATNCRTANCTFGYGTALHLVDNGSTLKRTRLDCIGGNCSLGPVWQGFDIVVESSLDDYTRGIAEVPFSWHAEALKTQAVAARSYAASFVVSTDHTAAGCFCAVRNSSAFQVYAGWVGGSALSHLWDSAALSTNGQVLVHPEAPDARIVRAYYSSSNGGASEWVAQKWDADLPYLVSVPDPYSLDAANPRASWTFEYTAAAVVDVVWGTSVDYTLTGAQVVANNVSGSAKTVRFTALTPNGASTSVDLSSASVSTAFGLYSWYFQIDDSAVAPPAPEGPTAVGVQDQRTGIWTLRFEDGSTSSFYFGDPSDIPFIGDWNGNGTETIGLYRESTGFLFLRYTNDQGIGDVQIYYGNPDDLPVAGDWNGDGIDTVGIYRPSEARFYLRNTNTQGIADVDVAFGEKGDVPIAGDWDGDGIDTVGVYRPSTRMLYLTNSIPGGQVDFSYHYEGAAAGDRIVAGDWNFDGVDTIGVFRPSDTTFYLRDTYTQSAANIAFSLGDSWMNPIAGFWGG
jgi:SpoIID/LytB domain protein